MGHRTSRRAATASGATTPSPPSTSGWASWTCRPTVRWRWSLPCRLVPCCESKGRYLPTWTWASWRRGVSTGSIPTPRALRRPSTMRLGKPSHPSGCRQHARAVVCLRNYEQEWAHFVPVGPVVDGVRTARLDAARPSHPARGRRLARRRVCRAGAPGPSRSRADGGHPRRQDRHARGAVGSTSRSASRTARRTAWCRLTSRPSRRAPSRGVSTSTAKPAAVSGSGEARLNVRRADGQSVPRADRLRREGRRGVERIPGEVGQPGRGLGTMPSVADGARTAPPSVRRDPPGRPRRGLPRRRHRPHDRRRLGRAGCVGRIGERRSLRGTGGAALDAGLPHGRPRRRRAARVVAADRLRERALALSPVRRAGPHEDDSAPVVRTKRRPRRRRLRPRRQEQEGERGARRAAYGCGPRAAGLPHAPGTDPPLNSRTLRLPRQPVANGARFALFQAGRGPVRT